MLNGDATQGKIANGGAIKKLLAKNKDTSAAIEDLYLRCLGRPPTEKESSKLKGYFGSGKTDEQVLTDIFWALLNSKEFIFNH